MTGWQVLPISLISLMTLGCGDPAKDLYETAQFEERQNNKAHARELYEQVVKQYPGTELATRSADRLAHLEEKQAPPR
jgi:hypothetical protein